MAGGKSPRAARTSNKEAEMKHRSGYRNTLPAVIFALLFILPPRIQASPIEDYGRLKVLGNYLCDENGQPIQLRGMSSHGLQWYGWGDCVTDASLDALAYEWQSGIFRVSMYVDEGGYKTDPAGYRAAIDTIVDEAFDRGMYVILDWHILNPGDPWENIAYAEAFFSYMSARHGSKGHVLYEICNEPNGVSWERIKSYAEAVIPLIRANDPQGIIIVGTPAWSSFGISEGRDPMEIVNNRVSGSNAHNLMYAFHFYAASHTSDYRTKIRILADKLPIFATEWGTQTYTGDGPNDVESSQQWVDLMAEKMISWTHWNFSDDWRSGAVLESGTCPYGPWTGTALKESGRRVIDWIRSSSFTYACADGLDNDGDGLVDLDDPGCESAQDNDETDGRCGAMETQMTVRDDWGTGYCADVTVTNNTCESVTWNVTVTVDGTVTHLWNGQFVQWEDSIVVEGDSWNSELEVGRSTSFGFCAIRNQPPATYACSDGIDNDGDGRVDMADPGCESPQDDDESDSVSGQVTVAVNVSDDWGTGYCARVTLFNSTAADVDWRVTLNVAGNIRSIWGALYEKNGDELTLEGKEWNNRVPAGGELTSIGFCADR